MLEDDIILPLPSGAITKTTAEEAAKMYNDGIAVDKIAEHFGVSPLQLKSLLLTEGIYVPDLKKEIEPEIIK